MKNSKLLYRILFITVFVGFGYLTFKGLGNNVFWDDEAYTALLAKSIVTTGQAKGWDGKNIHGWRFGEELNDQFINVFMPRLQLYTTAISMKLFGGSTFAARLPHAIFGLLALLFLYKYVRKFILKDPYWALLVPLYLGLTPSFYLYIRQCRYYAEVVLFTTISLYLYKNIFSIKWPGRILFILSLVAVFISNYICLVALVVALFAHVILFEKIGFDKKRWLSFFSVFVPTIILAILIFYYTNPTFQFMRVLESGNWFLKKLILLFWNFRDINFFEWFPVVLFIGSLYLICTKRRLDNSLVSHVFLIVVYIVIIVLISPQSVYIKNIADMRSLIKFFPVVANIADLRYLVGLFPLLAVVAVVSIKHLTRNCIFVAIPILLLCCLTNVFTLKPFTVHGWQTNLFSYIKEIHHDYETSYEAAIAYMKNNGRDNDMVMIWPEYMTFPIMYYCPDYYYCGLLPLTKSHFSQQALEHLPDYVFIEKAIPDWIICFGSGSLGLQNYFQFLNSKKIHYSFHAVLPVYWRDGIRPDLPHHIFEPIKEFDKKKDGIFIFKRTDI